MKRVMVVMSAYNGSKYITQQLDSIFRQKDVDVTCYVRNDGSTDNTLEVLNNLTPPLSATHLIIDDGDNVGWEKSFLLALRAAPEADYYAFADQDDIWFDDKLISAVRLLEKNAKDGVPMMVHCNKLSVGEDLKPFAHQVRRTPRPLNRQNAMVQEYAQGCAIVMNEAARQLVTEHIPKSKIAHDFWCGLLCYLFGEVLYDNTPRFYHISHGSNASGEGHTLSSWKNRLKLFFKHGNIYYAPYEDLMEGYGDRLTADDKQFLKKIKTYRRDIGAKFSLLFSPRFIRDSILGTLSLKAAILFNKL